MKTKEEALEYLDKTSWSCSTVEEVISIGWAICAILCFGFGFTIFGYIFTVKAVSDTAGAIRSAWREAKGALGVNHE